MIVFIIILFIISVILESLVSNLIVNFIPFFIPCFIVVFASLKINKDHFYKMLIIAGIIYDLMYTNQVILNALLFCFYGFLVSLILKTSKNFILCFLSYTVICLINVFVNFIIPVIQNNVTINSIVHKIFFSIPINISYFVIAYLLFIDINCLISNRKNKMRIPIN